MSSIFCCPNIEGYRNQRLSHEPKFSAFQRWASFPRNSHVDSSTSIDNPPYAVQLVKQVNYGPIESKRYFIVNEGADAEKAFIEVPEKWLIDANFQKLNAYKNFRCNVHDKFFEVNMYQKDPVNAHHWRANVARPAVEIDL